MKEDKQVLETNAIYNQGKKNFTNNYKHKNKDTNINKQQQWQRKPHN